MVEGSLHPVTPTATGQRLPDRVWRLLDRDGPSYPHALALALDARGAAISGALTSLVRRGRAAVAYRDGRRVFYEAVGGTAQPTPRLGLELLDLASTARHHAPAGKQLRPLADGQSALDLECTLLRASMPSFEIEALIADNRPVRGL